MNNKASGGGSSGDLVGKALNAKMGEDNINRYGQLINIQNNYDNTGGGNDSIEEYENIGDNDNEDNEDNDKNLTKIITIV